MSFNIITWNVATDGDYMAMEGALKQSLAKKEGKWTVSEGAPQMSDRAQFNLHQKEITAFRTQRVSDIFKEFSKDASIFCLQEVERDWDLSKIVPENFAYIKKGDQAILWDKNQFEISENTDNFTAGDPRYPVRAAIAVLKTITTGQQILVCSAHLTGCDPDQPSQDDAEQGDRELELLSEALNTYSKEKNIPYLVIGLDANVSRKYPARLKPLTESGFELDTIERGTNINLRKMEKKENPQIKIDYIAAKGFQSIQNPNDEFFNSEARSVPLGNLGLNPSDHIPLVQRITLPTPQNYFSGLYTKLTSIFK